MDWPILIEHSYYLALHKRSEVSTGEAGGPGARGAARFNLTEARLSAATQHLPHFLTGGASHLLATWRGSRARDVAADVRTSAHVSGNCSQWTSAVCVAAATAVIAAAAGASAGASAGAAGAAGAGAAARAHVIGFA